MFRAVIWGMSVVALAGCGQRVERPSASLTIEPPAVCRFDGHATVVTLDASSSSEQLSLVPSAPSASETPALDFDWTLSGDDHDIVRGDLASPTIEITMAGDRPLGVELTVSNTHGGSLTTRRSVAVTLGCEDAR